MNNTFGFFDVDSRELDEQGRGLTYRPRVWPIAPQLERVYALIERKQFPLVFTTCCSGRMLTAERGLPGTLQVPLEAADSAWRARVGEHRRFYLAKRTHGNPQQNLACRTFDMFQHNPNAAPLFRELKVGGWVVFGNGFDLCVNSAVRGLLKLGLPVTLLEDVRASSGSGTPESERETIAALRALGANVTTLRQFMALPEVA